MVVWHMKAYWYNTLLDLAIWLTRWADRLYLWAWHKVDAIEHVAAGPDAETLDRLTHE